MLVYEVPYLDPEGGRRYAHTDSPVYMLRKHMSSLNSIVYGSLDIFGIYVVTTFTIANTKKYQYFIIITQDLIKTIIMSTGGSSILHTLHALYY